MTLLAQCSQASSPPFNKCQPGERVALQRYRRSLRLNSSKSAGRECVALLETDLRRDPGVHGGRLLRALPWLHPPHRRRPLKFGGILLLTCLPFRFSIDTVYFQTGSPGTRARSIFDKRKTMGQPFRVRYSSAARSNPREICDRSLTQSTRSYCLASQIVDL